MRKSCLIIVLCYLAFIGWGLYSIIGPLNYNYSWEVPTTELTINLKIDRKKARLVLESSDYELNDTITFKWRPTNNLVIYIGENNEVWIPEYFQKDIISIASPASHVSYIPYESRYGWLENHAENPQKSDSATYYNFKYAIFLNENLNGCTVYDRNKKEIFRVVPRIQKFA